MKYSGIDLHSTNSAVVVTDEADRVLVQRRLANDLGAIQAVLEPHRAELLVVVVESSYNWYWLVDGLQDAGYRVYLANPSAIKRYEGLKHSRDETDAAYLAQLLRLGILRTGHIYPREHRAVRDLARKRLQLVRSRTQQVLAVENIVARETGASIKSNAVKRLKPEEVSKLGLRPDVELAMQSNLAVIQALNAQIGRLEARLLEWARPGAGSSLSRNQTPTDSVLEFGSPRSASRRKRAHRSRDRDVPGRAYRVKREARARPECTRQRKPAKRRLKWWADDRGSGGCEPSSV